MGEDSWFSPDGRTDECKWETVIYTETVILDSNKIEGKVPDGVCLLHNQGNLAQISTDCTFDSISKVECSCCFNCPIGQVKELTACPSDTTTGFEVGNIEAQERTKKIKSKCIELSGDAVCQHNTPQNLAMRWLIEDDKLQLSVASEDFIQRYVVIVLYFSLGPDAWVDSFWMSPNEDECEIAGVVCDWSKQITALIFREYDFCSYVCIYVY